MGCGASAPANDPVNPVNPAKAGSGGADGGLDADGEYDIDVKAAIEDDSVTKG
jgi:hypothetical protein